MHAYDIPVRLRSRQRQRWTLAPAGRSWPALSAHRFIGAPPAVPDKLRRVGSAAGLPTLTIRRALLLTGPAIGLVGDHQKCRVLVTNSAEPRGEVHLTTSGPPLRAAGSWWALIR